MMMIPHTTTTSQLSAIQIVALLLRALSLICKVYCMRAFRQVTEQICTFIQSGSSTTTTTTTNPAPSTTNAMTEFINKENARFSAWVGSCPTDADANIDAVFFDGSATGFQDAMSERDNAMEKKWRTRVLWVMTPRGNVAMFYDAFKEAFAYYADTNAMPYPLLNALAMRYVRTFQCLSFFVDEQSVSTLTPPTATTGLIIVARKARQRAIDDAVKEAKRGLMWQGSGNAVAAAAAAADWKKKLADAPVFRPKLKAVLQPPPPASTKMIKQLEVVVYNYNTFVNVGRMNQYCPLMKQQPKQYSSSPMDIPSLSHFAQNTAPMFECPTIDYYKPFGDTSTVIIAETATATATTVTATSKLSFAEFKRLREQASLLPVVPASVII